MYGTWRNLIRLAGISEPICGNIPKPKSWRASKVFEQTKDVYWLAGHDIDKWRVFIGQLVMPYAEECAEATRTSTQYFCLSFHICSF